MFFWYCVRAALSIYAPTRRLGLCDRACVLDSVWVRSAPRLCMSVRAVDKGVVAIFAPDSL